MRVLLTSILCLPLLVFAESVTVDKPVLCDSPKIVFEAVSGGSNQEEPSWVGSDDKSKYVLMVNKKTGTWTMIQYNNNIACIIGLGENQKQLFLGPKV